MPFSFSFSSESESQYNDKIRTIALRVARVSNEGVVRLETERADNYSPTTVANLMIDRDETAAALSVKFLRGLRRERRRESC